MIDQCDESTVVSLNSTASRLGQTCVFLLVALVMFGLVIIVHWAVRGTVPVGSLPWIVVVFDELVISVGILFLLKTLSLWFPACAIWVRFEQSYGHHLAILGTITFILVCLAIMTGILYALGII